MPTTTRLPWPLRVAGTAAVPGGYLGLADYAGLPVIELAPFLGALVFGGAIVGAAFLLSWAAEAAEVEVSAGVALAFLAFLAVLPEYGVDFVFTMRAGQTNCADDSCALALANMTGANRVLVGIGWPIVVLLARTWPAGTRTAPRTSPACPRRATSGWRTRCRSRWSSSAPRRSTR